MQVVRYLLDRGRWLALPACMLAVSLTGCESASEANGRRLGNDLGAAMEHEGRGKCTPYAARNLWRCSVESDPGSGWSGRLHLKVDKNGCWHARYVGPSRNGDSTASQSDLSVGDWRANGHTFRGCTDLEG
jgi:hypothetical protein